MRLLIDASGVTAKKAGVGVYAKNLVDALARNPEVRLFLVAQDDDAELDYSRFPNVTMLWVRSLLFRRPPLRLLFEQTFLPRLLRKHRIDVVHSLHYSFPLIRAGARRVVTIHDMTFFSMPEFHLASKTRFFRYFIRKSVTSADGLIFISHSAQSDYLTRLGQPRALRAVIHHGIGETFAPCTDGDGLQEVRRKYGLPPRYIAYVGTIEPRKNLTRLVEAYAEVVKIHPDVFLVIAGMKGWMFDGLFERVRQLELERQVIFPGFVEEADKRHLLCGAEVFAYVSLYEGFGLPVLEALACGVPTVASDTSSIPEVAGDAALLMDPTSAPQIAQALLRLLSNSGLRAKLAEKSLKQAARFTWERTAGETLAMYRAVEGAGLGTSSDTTSRVG